MNNILPVIILVFWSFNVLNVHGQSKIIKEIKDFQKQQDEEFADPAESPLTKEDLAKFTGHDFYPIDTSFYIKAKFVRTENEQPFQMKTTTNRLPVYVKYGEAHFTLSGKKFVLSIFQNQELMKKRKYRDYLFLPFTDLTNGFETYGGGRYLGLSIPKGDEIIIDFNKAYNPYCAYNHRYSCPLVPKENHLEIEIKAGVMLESNY